ncbi:MAG: reverse transcriptase family protein, partial [Pseudomonadota bacterium]
LTLGLFPVSEKRAIITPVIKKESLDKDDLMNYRPVSQLTFLSKFIERVISNRVDAFLSAHSLLPPFQSAYRKFHSTETLLVHLCNELSVARGKRMVSCLISLDLSAAFDTVDHTLLLDRLFHSFGFSGTVLQLFSSYLSGRSNFVSVDSSSSELFSLPFGVPQGSVLGPRLYSLYVAPVSSIINSYNISHHVYADDTCIFVSFSSTMSDSTASNVEHCLIHLCDWFNCNFLKLNPTKTNILLFNTDKIDAPLNINVLGHSPSVTNSLKYLGVLFDDSLMFDKHVITVCKSAFIFLRSLYRIRRFLKRDTVLLVINAFVMSRIDYCNAILSYCNKYSIKRLQRVQNCFARLVYCLPRFSSTSALIKQLGWLRIAQRVDFKLCCLAHKCIYGSCPDYLKNLIAPVSSSATPLFLRSTSKCLLYCPISRASFVRRSFSFCVPRLWNSVPDYIRCERRYFVFRRLLKDYLL